MIPTGEVSFNTKKAIIARNVPKDISLELENSTFYFSPYLFINT